MNMDNNINTNIQDFLQKIKNTEEEYSGVEGLAEEPDDLESYDSEMPYDISNLRVEQKMITIFQVEYWIESGILQLQPEYQRNLVWDDQRKSALIESILLRIPIPSFYIDERSDGGKSVIDGLQRLSTIHEYINGNFRLKKMQYLTSCEKKCYSELDMKYKSYIMDFSLSINTIDARCPMMVKFDIFRRVNTGGLPLNSQEIRNIMAEKKVKLLLKKMSECTEFVMATNGGINDVRMGAQELCLRYIAILKHYDWEKHDFHIYNGLAKIMDETIVLLNNSSEKELEYIYSQFKNVMRQSNIILGEMSFTKLGQKRINASLFTSWAVVLTNKACMESWINKNRNAIKDRYKRMLLEGTELYHAVTSSTGRKNNIVTAIESIRRIVDGGSI